MVKNGVRSILLVFSCWLAVTVIFGVAHAAVYPYVKVQGRQLMTDFDQTGVYTPYFIKGVDYEPTPVGRYMSDWGWPANYPLQENNIYNDDAILERDFALLKAMNVNTIRIWQANDITSAGRFPNKLTAKTLEYAHRYNIKVIPGFALPAGGESFCSGSTLGYNRFVDFTDQALRNRYIYWFREFMKPFRNSPDILFWAIGNENNYSLNKNDPQQVAAYYSLVEFMAGEAYDIERAGRHPVAIIDGDIEFIGRADFQTRDADMPHVDIWGTNVYRGKSFTDLFTTYKARSAKPLWISEYGIDAFYAPDPANPEVGVEDQQTQADWDTALWDEIVLNRDVTIGGSVMEYSDEWWKPNEWNCEESGEACRTQIVTSSVQFYWDTREEASNYHLSVGTYFGAANVYDAALGLATQATVGSVPVNGGMVYVKLTYNVRGVPVTEYAQYTTAPSPQPGSNNRVKVKWYGVRHNGFGFGAVDTSCPRDGVPDYVPPFPDKFFHEEWWGLVSIRKNGYGPDTVTPRKAYYALQSRFAQGLPSITQGAPSGVVLSGNVPPLSVSTDVDAVCKYDTVAGTPYGSMRYTFSVNGGKAHSQPLSGLIGGTAYAFYVRCQDMAGNVNAADYPVSFSVGVVLGRGDINGDGAVTAADALLAAKHALGLAALTSGQLSRADVNSDGSVTVYDAALIARYAAGLISQF
jgi:hypothetical protein